MGLVGAPTVLAATAAAWAVVRAKVSLPTSPASFSSPTFSACAHRDQSCSVGSGPPLLAVRLAS